MRFFYFLLAAAASPVVLAAPPTRDAVEAKLATLWKAHVNKVKTERAAEIEAKAIQNGDQTLRYLSKTFGEKPEGGRSLFISMHGGGGGPAQMNDGQWRNQIRLYQPKEGIYLAPRAPGNTWDLWHTASIDPLFDRLIESMVVFEDVNPDRVYLMGYSAGGDGVYQLAPRMSDRFAAAAMMAGHPNETSPVGLRNIPFALQVGALDAAYKRNEVAVEWGEKLSALQKTDPGGYEHLHKVHEGKPHWMELEDRIAVPWMAKFERRRFPDRVVWKQDNVTHNRLYWLALPDGHVKERQLIRASREGQTITIEEVEDTQSITLMLNDEMIDLDEAITVIGPDGETLFQGKAMRSIEVLRKRFAQRPDRRMAFYAEVTVELK